MLVLSLIHIFHAFRIDVQFVKTGDFVQCFIDDYGKWNETCAERLGNGDLSLIHIWTDAVLEPSYICEALGLQGRLDYMQRDMTSFIEMKSGKADRCV